MNIDSGPLKTNVDTSEQAAMALMTMGTTSTVSKSIKKRGGSSSSGGSGSGSASGSSTHASNDVTATFMSNYNKPFGEYLEELREACHQDIFIKRTANIKYQPKKWSNIQAYIVRSCSITQIE